MKRVIVSFLVVVMSLSLCACGQSGSDAQSELYEKYQGIIDNLENGHYQNAIDLIENMAEQNSGDANADADSDHKTDSDKPVLTPEQIAWQNNAVGTWFPDESASKDGHTGFTLKDDGTCVVDGKDYTWTIGNASETNAQIEVLDGQTKVHMLQFSLHSDFGYKKASLYTYSDAYSAHSTNGTYYRDGDYSVVEITNDNWQDYFEIKEVISVKENPFGEISQFYGYTYFVLKDTCGVANVALSSGGVECQFVSACQDVTVDLTNLTYAPVGEVHNTSQRNRTSEWSSSTDFNGVRYYGASIDSFWVHDVDKSLTDTVWRPVDIEILRVQGTLYIVK